MKIEVAESLFLSWLRHVRSCRLAQLNWKPSKTWERTNIQQVEALYANSRDFFQQKHNLDLYGKNSSVSQLVQQAEIDAIGICDLEERPSIIAVDVAFHEGGLNYGGKTKTVERVVKKILRTVCTLESYFGEYAQEIIFAAPKIHNAAQAPLEEAMAAVDQFLEQEQISAECRLVSNADFFSEIVEPVTQLSGQVADTSELFMRSMQLIQMAPSAARPVRSKTTPTGAVTDEVHHEIKIGQLAQTEFKRLLEGQHLTEAEIEKLCTKRYSKRVFGLNFPLLKQSTDLKDRFDELGHGRYYSKVVAGRFLLCNQWFRRDRERLEAWLAKTNRRSEG